MKKYYKIYYKLIKKKIKIKLSYLNRYKKEIVKLQNKNKILKNYYKK